MGRLIALGVLAASLVVATPAAAAPDVGALSPVECFNDAGSDTDCPISQQGLDGAAAVAVSPNGKSAYVAAGTDRAVNRYDRSPLGTLTSQGCVSDNLPSPPCGTTQEGLLGANDVVVSPDGRTVYTVSTQDRAIVRTNRDPSTGVLTPSTCFTDTGSGVSCVTTQGLNGAFGLAISPDGASVYVASLTDSAIVRFDRNPSSGALTAQGCISDSGDPAGCGATTPGLGGARSVVVSPDGKSVYVAGTNDSAVVRFDRNTTTGALTPAGCIADVGVSGCAANQQGLLGAIDLAISPDGESLYAGSTQDFAVVQFDRSPTDGALTGVGCVGDAGSSNCASTQEGLDSLLSIDISPDGRSLYAVSVGDDALAGFDRDKTSGALSGAGCIKDVDGAAACTGTQQGLDGASGVSVSPDGKSVYVASIVDDALVTFDRVPDTSNHNRIELPLEGASSGLADPYPSTIEVSGLDARISDVSVTLEGLTHTFPRDLDILLEGPDGQRVILLSDGGGGAPGVSAVSLTFDDSAGQQAPEFALATTGSYRPTNYDSVSDSLPTPSCNPGPAAPDQEDDCLARAFNGTDPNGTWSLYALDDQADDEGYLAHGWSLDITTDVDAPETTIDSGPSGTITTGSASFGFSSSESGSTFECRIDGEAFASCGSPKAYAGLADGSHTFSVRATDGAGNVDASPATRTFSVNTATSPPADTKVDGSVTAAKKQKQKGKKIQVAFTVDAAEPLKVQATAKAKVSKSGGVMTGDLVLVPAGSTVLKLRPDVRKQEKAIAKALKRRKKGSVSIDVELTDEAGNSTVTKLQVKLNF